LIIMFWRVLLLAALVVAQAPQFGAVVTQDGLNTIVDDCQPILIDAIQTAQIDDIHGSTGTPIGDVDYDITAIQIQEFNIGAMGVDLLPGKGLQASDSGASIHVHINWGYSMWLASDSGDADITASASFAAPMAIGVDGNNKPTLNVEAFNFQLNDLDIDLHGGASWLYQVFIDVFSGQIQDSIQNTINDQMPGMVNDLAAPALATLDTLIEISISDDMPTLMLDYGLAGAPVFNDQFMAAPSVGNVYITDTQEMCPLTPNGVPQQVTGRQYEVSLDDTLPSCVGWAMQKLDWVNYVYTSDDMPDWFPMALDTTSLQYLIPPLYVAFPDRSCQATLGLGLAPAFSSSTTGILLDATLDIAMDIVATDTDPAAHAFTIGMDCTIQVDVDVDATNMLITGKVNNATFTTSTVDSDVGDIDMGPLDSMFNLILENAVLPYANGMLAAGIPIPVVDGVTISAIELDLADGYITVGADISYSPPPPESAERAGYYPAY